MQGVYYCSSHTINLIPLMENAPLVSLIALNYNNTAITMEFLESTKNLKYPNYEIIIVDNNSNEDPTGVMLAKYPHVKVHVLEKNQGFTGGNNRGMEQATGDYYFIVNNDTEVTDDLLDKLVEPFLNDNTIGVVSPKIKFFQSPDIIQYAGFNKINPYTGRTTATGSKEIDRGQHDKSGLTHGAHGAAMLVKKEVAEKVGMFYDDFFIYYEEWDWSTRIIKAGYKIYYRGDATIYHKESMTMGKESTLKAYYLARNRILYMKRNSTSFDYFLFLMFLLFFTIPKTTIKYILKGQFEHLRAFYKGLAWSFFPRKYTP